MMADQAAVTVGTSSTELIAADDSRVLASLSTWIYITNLDVADVFVGDEDVTTATGTPIAAGETMVFPTRPRRALHGISAAGSAPVRYFIR